MKALKCLVCGAEIEVTEYIFTSYEDIENGSLDVVITCTGYCTKCNKKFKGYYDVEVED